MTDLPANLLKLVTELIKYYVEKALGENASAILAQGLTEIVGETAKSKITDFLDQGELSKQVFAAFKEADNCFYKTVDDDVLKQAIISNPLAGLEQWEAVAKQLPSTLDDSGLFILIRTRFEQDWLGILSDQQLDQAAMIYRDCLDRAFATKLDQLEPTLFRKIERIDLASREIKENQRGLSTQIQEIYESTLRLTGLTTQLLVQDFHLTPPDSPPIQPEYFIAREDIHHELIRIIQTCTWLALIDGPGKGKSQLANSIYHSYCDPSRWWVSLRNKGDTATKHFRDQIVCWLIRLTGQPTIWLLYQAGIISFIEIIPMIAEKIGKEGLLIVDDLPDPTTYEDLYGDLEITAREFLSHDSKIITTSQRVLPPHLIVNLPSPIIIRSCPYFTDVDILALLSQAKIPIELQNENIAIWITAITKGHPILVAATIRWLEQQGAQISLSTYDGLITGEPVKDTLEYNRRLLLRTLDSSSKDLLFRLSIVGEKFDRELATDIADISPPVEHPGNTLDNLIGPWLEHPSGEFFEITPLLENSGRENLPLETQKQVHLIIVQRYLQQRTIKISDAHHLIRHLLLAQDYVRFAEILVELLQSTKSKAQAKYIDWACGLFLGASWPDELNIGYRIMIRAAQVRNLALAGSKFEKANNDLNFLLAQVNVEEYAPPILFAYVNTGFGNVDLPIEITIPRSFEFIHILYRSPAFHEIIDEDLLNHLPIAIWAQGMRAQNKEQVRLFIDAIKGLSNSEQQFLFSASLVMEEAVHMIDQCWFFEASKPPEQQDWVSILSFLDNIEEYGYVKNNLCFQLAIARSRAVIYSDYLKQPSKALEILDSFSTSKDLDATFLKYYSIGCVSSDAGHINIAADSFSEALSVGGNSFSFYRLDNMRRYAIEKSRQQDWKTAKSLLITTVHHFQRNEGKEFFTWESLELLGELAYIHWSNGDFTKACGAMYGYVMGLVAEKDVENPRFKEAFNKAGHGLGWFVAISITGEPPSRTQSGDKYTPVYAGLFGIRNQNLGNFTPLIGFSKAVLLTQLAMLAYASGLIRMSWILYKLALDHYQEEGKAGCLRADMIYLDLAPLEAFFGDPSVSLEYALQAKNVLALMRVVDREKEELPSSMDLSMELFSSKTSDVDYQIAERHLLYVVFAPMLSYFMGANLNTTEIILKLTEWEKTILEHEAEFLYTKEWLMIIQFLNNLIRFWKEGHQIDFDFEVFGDKSSFEIFCHLFSSDRPDISLKEAFRKQVSAIIAIPQYGRFAKYIFPGLGRFIHRYWLVIAQTRRFALRNPQLLYDELLSTSPNLGGATLAHVLKSAGQAVGVNLPNDIKEQLNQVWKISQPWDFNPNLFVNEN